MRKPDFGSVKAGKKPAKVKAAKSPLAGVTIGLADAAALIGKSETHVLSLVKAGYLKKSGRGLYRPAAVAQAALKFREANDRRSSQTAENARLQAARARRVELMNAQTENKLIAIEDVQISMAEIFGVLVSELHGLPAGASRDLAVRAEIQRVLNATIDRARDRIDKLDLDLREGRGIILEGDDAD